jgi:hypothetical protein
MFGKYEILEKVQRAHHHSPYRLFNVEEMGLSAVQTAVMKAVARRGNM